MKRFVAMLLIAGAATIGTAAVAGAENPGPPDGGPGAVPGAPSAPVPVTAAPSFTG
jgi:hypothetical protein